MSSSTSGAKKPRAPRVPYTPPAARRSATSNNAGETRRTHDADRSLSKQRPRREAAAADAEGNNNHSRGQGQGPPAEQPAKPERAGKRTEEEKDTGGERLESASADTRKPRPSSPGGVDRESPEVKAVSAGSAETSGRKPRQAWAQYVPPGRRGAARSNEGARSSAPESPPPTPTEESASGGGSSGSVQQAAAHQPSTAVVADEPAAEEHTLTGASMPTSSTSPSTSSSSSSSSSNACVDGSNAASAVPSEEGQAPVPSRSSPPPSPPRPPPPPPESTGTALAQKPAGIAPSPAVHQERQDGKEASHPPTPETVSDAVETPCKESTNTNKADSTDAVTDIEDKGDQELPPLKPPAARYVPPGRRKALDAEAAAAAAGGGGDGAAGDGIGPLWTSRAPVRVSQRERATDKEASAAARPAPARVARVVGGGMSAYGANISEYSGECMVFMSSVFRVWARSDHRTGCDKSCPESYKGKRFFKIAPRIV